ncbi:MAG: MerR family transcriptional regulator [Gemmatimonadetes bacterium]|nr:MerR family transcriptional regulator [Gemmatimonadota bacterium]
MKAQPPRTPKHAAAQDVGHPISVVAERAGVSPDVLRVWERRYAAIEPMRSAGRQRVYSDAQLARAMLLAEATRHGRNISLVAKLPHERLEALLVADGAARHAAMASGTRLTAEADNAAAEALACVAAFDSAGFEFHLRRALATQGVLHFIDDVVPALMRQIGDAWHAGSITIAQEHFATAAVGALVTDATHTAPAAANGPAIVMATPASERHMIGAALAAASARLAGWSVTQLGADLPLDEVPSVVARTRARAVALSVVYAPDAAATSAAIGRLHDALPDDVPVLIGGSAAATVAPASRTRVRVCGSLREMRDALGLLAARV